MDTCSQSAMADYLRRGAWRQRTGRRGGRHGVVLVLVLVVVSLLTLAAFTFADVMMSHRKAVKLSGRQTQAEALVQSGVDSIKLFLMQPKASQSELGGHYNNPSFFQAVPVLMDDTAEGRGDFTVISPNLLEDGTLGGVRYGLEDESTRLNLNALLLADKLQENGGRTLLMSLPGMTEDVADAIMDWLDEDDEPREYGAETDYYQSLDPPYAAKNGPFDTVEELLLVRGVTPQMLFGLDANRNGVVDAYEMSNSTAGTGIAGTSGATGSTVPMSADGTTPTGSLDRGWSAYLTLYSAEANLDSEGNPRIYLNQDNMEDLYNQLSQVFSADWATFIVAYRQNGPSSGNGGGGGGGSDNQSGGAMGELDLSKPASDAGKIRQVLDLVGAKVRVQFQGEDQARVVDSPFSSDLGAMNIYFPALLDKVSVNKSPTIPGRININQAPRVLLEGIPGMTTEIVDQIMELRVVDDSDENAVANRRFETWLLTSGVVTLDQMRLLTPLVNAGGDVFRFQAVGYFEDGAASSRAEVIIDATSHAPRVVSWRDISHLGRGYPLEILGVQLIEGY